MASDPGNIEQAVSRALRANLDRIQRTADEVRVAVADLVASCASSRPSNALPSMLRAQTAAASLAAALEVLARFVTAALQPAERSPVEKEALRLVGLPPPEPSPAPPLPHIPTPMGKAAAPAEALQEADMVAEGAPVIPPEMAVEPAEPAEPAESAEPEPVAEQAPAFDLASLSSEEQELHRRANRVAKVSMQDIKMLKPDDVRLGREHKDLCVRLRDEIEKAHREYERRFRPILGHPTDYFYRWMVEILAGGDPQALGEYPYSSPVLRR
jgi:hypothetical protein